MYYYNENFYHDLEQLIDDLDFEKVEELADDFSITYKECDEEPIVQLSADNLGELIRDWQEERFSEDDSEGEHEAIVKILSENIDFDKINSEMPTLWYPSKRKVQLTKADIVAFYSEP